MLGACAPIYDETLYTRSYFVIAVPSLIYWSYITILGGSQGKTPHSSSYNTPVQYTPNQYTPKNTPTVDSGGASSRSRCVFGVWF